MGNLVYLTVSDRAMLMVNSAKELGDEAQIGDVPEV